MRILNGSLLIILTLVSESICFDLKFSACSFHECHVHGLVITNPDDAITSVNGNTLPLEFHTLIIRNQIVNFVPRNISSFFPRLRQLHIFNSSLKWIKQENIRELTSLTELYLDRNNLKILEKGLFDFNTELESINISANQLQYVHKDIFYNLNNLHRIDLLQNKCIQSSFYDAYYASSDPTNEWKNEVVDKLNDYCQSWEDACQSWEEDAYSFCERHHNKLISDLRSEIDKLTHRLKACDGNLDAALTNYRPQNLMNLNMESIDGPIVSLMIDLTCYDDHCIAIDFKVPFTNLSIEGKNYTSLGIKSLKILQQQTLFLPQNLAEHFPLLNDLMVAESGLCEIDYNVLKGLDLFTLNLTNNKIHEIAVETFAGLENLQELDLSFNRIHTLFDGVFASLKNLQKLYLNSNYLTSISVEDLKHLERLNDLHLQNNRLKFISATLLTPFFGLELSERILKNFNGLFLKDNTKRIINGGLWLPFISLKSINLTGNVCINMSHPTSTLIDIEATIIDNCIAPVELNCKMIQIESTENVEHSCQVEELFIENPITKISKLNGLVQGLNNTVKIFLAENQSMKFIPFQLSHQLPHLQRIEIQRSKLNALQKMDFAGFLKLTEIVIKGNNLTWISEETFDAIPQLELLDLSSNNIVFLPTNVFAKLGSLHTLLLSHNRIVRFTADILPRKNVIYTFQADNNQLEVIETQAIRLLRKAKLIDLTGNVCIDMRLAKTENNNRALVELSGEIDLNCSVDDYNL